MAPISQSAHPSRPTRTATNRQVQPTINAPNGRERSPVTACMATHASPGLPRPTPRRLLRDWPQAWQKPAPGINSVAQPEHAIAGFAAVGITVTGATSALGDAFQNPDSELEATTAIGEGFVDIRYRNYATKKKNRKLLVFVAPSFLLSPPRCKKYSLPVISPTGFALIPIGPGFDTLRA